MTTKVCGKCKVEKDVGEFPRDARKSAGVGSTCKVCFSARARETYRLSPDKVLDDCQVYRTKNVEKVRAAHRATRSNLKDSYVRCKLRLDATFHCHHALIELKREQLMMHRATKELQQTLKEIEK